MEEGIPQALLKILFQARTSNHLKEDRWKEESLGALEGGECNMIIGRPEDLIEMVYADGTAVFYNPILRLAISANKLPPEKIQEYQLRAKDRVTQTGEGDDTYWYSHTVGKIGTTSGEVKAFYRDIHERKKRR